MSSVNTPGSLSMVVQESALMMMIHAACFRLEPQLPKKCSTLSRAELPPNSQREQQERHYQIARDWRVGASAGRTEEGDSAPPRGDTFEAMFVEDVSELYWTSAYSLAFYLCLIAVVNLTRFDAFILSKSRDPKVRKEAYAGTVEGTKNRVYMDSTIQSLLSSILSTAAAFHLVYIHR